VRGGRPIPRRPPHVSLIAYPLSNKDTELSNKDTDARIYPAEARASARRRQHAGAFPPVARANLAGRPERCGAFAKNIAHGAHCLDQLPSALATAGYPAAKLEDVLRMVYQPDDWGVLERAVLLLGAGGLRDPAFSSPWSAWEWDTSPSSTATMSRLRTSRGNSFTTKRRSWAESVCCGDLDFQLFRNRPPARGCPPAGRRSLRCAKSNIGQPPAVRDRLPNRPHWAMGASAAAADRTDQRWDDF